MKTRNKTDGAAVAEKPGKWDNENLLAIRDDEFRRRIQKMADESGRSLGYYIRWCLTNGLPYLEEIHEAEQTSHQRIVTRAQRERGR